MTHNVYQIIHTKKLGLDVWLVTKDGRTLHTFLSEQYARARFERLKQEVQYAVSEMQGN